MASMNVVHLIGNLGADPEVRFAPNGAAVANLRVATNETWKDKDGKQQERTEWHRVVVWGKQAESCGEYLKKGRQVAVTGKLQTREWLDKENKKNWSTEILASQVIFLGQGQSNSRRPEPGDFGTPPRGFEDSGKQSSTQANGDEDIPF